MLRMSPPAETGAARLTPRQRIAALAIGALLLLALAALAVGAARWFSATPAGQAFLTAFPGSYPLPDAAPVGIPAWVGWQHFLNTFFLLLIVRTGLQVRREKRPAAFWSPRGDPRRRLSLTLWLHLALDIVWVASGVVFVVLLFATGQWMRLVPTSWEVVPNALSAGLQYVSLDWPTENGWVAYNALQQLAYFSIVFLAAPLAIATGVRLSSLWPKNAPRLDRLVPWDATRRIHVGVMWYFIAFTIVHVALVFATGALRNLNHMYAARGSTDPDAFAGDPTGLVIFALSLLVLVAGWVAARPSVLIPLARLFGEVKVRG
jgi:thiosulfate reductase cytochrome b subunit